MQGETVSIEFSSADASTAAAVTLKDADGATRTLASNERLLIDTLTASLAAAVLLVTVISDNDADGAIDAGERLAAFGANTGNFEAGPEGQPGKTGITPKVKASGAGQVDITGTGRIIKTGSVAGVTRPAFKETFGGH
jgi:hypothetical protein